ncbi:MAG: DNA-deoxyinosine glycosylase, partial [Planctomycetes bacterium]|nr:DNA-deoxyinosine glycosylase [Planctomycetota bacterium]
MSERVDSFAPIAGPRARLLIVGSIPGARSLQAGQYYAHPQNAFWPIVGAVLGFDHAQPYPERTRQLRRHGVALWDVLQSCERAGSLDSAIVADSVRVNDFAAFFARHRRIDRVLCNGGTAFAKFDRLVRPELAASGIVPTVVRMPSTSPAHAGLSRAGKLA